MRAHLVIDAVNALAFLGAPLLLPDEEREVRMPLAGIGAFELLVTPASRSGPSLPASDP